ncbi:MAG: branched-chain amino acid transaminase [Candidatus Marinimicrobia bacterium]|nr:branched-chain amino acid transaminase [Candidatus Neomarinimicrobiota bacterium]
MADQSKLIWFNGEIIPWDEANIHVMSHVLHYGSGVFEGIKCYSTENGPAIFRLEDHIERLFISGEKYGIIIPFTPNELTKACVEIVDLNGFENCYIRPIAFYGYDTLGVHPKNCPVEVAVASFFWGAYLGEDGIENGVDITVSPWKRLSLEAFPSSAKASGQYLNSMLAVKDARERGYDEALLLNQEGFIAEGSGQNIFIVKDNKVITNGENASILMGITRETIIQLCKDMNLEVQITDISKDMLLNADEAFFTGTASEITPISSVDDAPFGDGTPGIITLQLKEKYLNIIHGKDNQYKHWLTQINQEDVLNSVVSE